MPVTATATTGRGFEVLKRSAAFMDQPPYPVETSVALRMDSQLSQTTHNPDDLINRGLKNPPNLAHYREQLFSLPVIMTLSPEDFHAYWPYVSNVWCLVNCRERPDGIEVMQYTCRLRRPTWSSKAKTQNKVRKIREGNTCQASCRVEFSRAANAYWITRTGASSGHTHSLRDRDQCKKNNGLRTAVNRMAEVAPNLTGAQLLKSLREVSGTAQMAEAGGQFLTSKDVTNWMQLYRTRKADS